jgi:TRAP-type C4-dicarboxylate transport system substrate-binding protein
MKKAVAVILVVCMSLVLFAGCTGTKTEEPASTAAVTSTATAASSVSEPAESGKDANGFYTKPLFELSYADQNPASLAISKFPQDAADKIFQETKGAVKINTYFSESLVKYSEMLNGVCQGMSDISYMLSAMTETTQIWPLLWDRLYPEGAPKVDKMTAIYQELLDTVPGIQEEMEKAGAHWLSIDATPGRHLHSTKGFYIKPEDIKGKNIGATGADMLLYNEIGGSAVKLSTSERYTSLQSGLIEAMSTHWNSWESNKLNELTKFHTEFGAGGIELQARGFVINLNKWKSLPEEYQKIITDAYTECAVKLSDYDLGIESKARQLALDEGEKIYTLNATEMAAWAPYATKANDKWIEDAKAKGIDVQAAYDKLMQLVSEAIK